MTKKSQPVVFFGTENFSLAALASLIEADYRVGAVVTKPDTPRGRGKKLTPPAVKTLAEQHSIPVLQPERLDDKFIEQLTRLTGSKPRVGVLSSYGKIVPQAVLDLFTPGIINIHPSLLPKYRGPSPIESAILNNDQQTGVSIIKLVAKMDAGPVYSQAVTELTGRETKPELYEHLAQIGSQLLVDSLPAITSGELTPKPQDESQATYCQLLQKSDGVLEPNKLTAEEAERRVRAFLGFPKTRLQLENESLIITKAHVDGQPKTPLDTKFSNGAYLIVDELLAPSGRKMSAEAYLRGRR